MKLADLHEFLFGEGFEDAHRAKSDVMATVRCFIELCKRGDIVL
jgi:DNA polymerase-3 subunit alpha